MGGVSCGASGHNNGVGRYALDLRGRGLSEGRRSRTIDAWMCPHAPIARSRPSHCLSGQAFSALHRGSCGDYARPHTSAHEGGRPVNRGEGKNAMAAMTANELGPMLTASEVAEMLHLHVNTVKRLGDRGELPFFRVCKRGDRRFRLEDVMDFLVRNR